MQVIEQCLGCGYVGYLVQVVEIQNYCCVFEQFGCVCYVVVYFMGKVFYVEGVDVQVGDIDLVDFQFFGLFKIYVCCY